MSLDGIFLNSIVNSLHDNLTGGRVDKIHQPDKNEIVISIRNRGENFKLLITVASSSPRLHITNINRKNPEQPPMFCMLLRKHLLGSRVRDIKQINFDRIAEITFETKDELGRIVDKSLIIEIMGKHSNIIFVKENGIIIDSLKRITENISSVRQVYPGLTYTYPPGAEKLNPMNTTMKLFFDKIDSANSGIYVYDFLYKNFTGISPFISREICYLANLNESTHLGELNELNMEKLWNAFDRIINKVKSKDYLFKIYYDQDENQYGFYCFDVEYLKSYKSKIFPELGELLDEYYWELDRQNKINQRVNSLIKSLNTKLERNYKKVEKQRTELLNAENREKYKIYGELILANLHKTPENNKLTAINYYDPEMKEITIPLDPRLNLSLNSQKYFKRYNKLKNAEEELQKLIDSTLEEISYLENILYSIEACESQEDLDDIYSELMESGFIKRKSNTKKSQPAKITTYISSGGHEILVGKNNTQNDSITFKIAKKEDYWFHAKGIPGSHVIIRTNGDELTDEEFVEAARIAAYYSKGRNSNTVEVDYTKKSNIKKPPNSKPGFVIYDSNFSMTVKPDIEGIKTKD
ncbi:MAG TPA: fibronectin/fibrinogen-binding protein [Tissierellia bacterium]|nr:fibronectin/fibrinogen-binding protein [Tissierellia bacterium]